MLTKNLKATLTFCSQLALIFLSILDLIYAQTTAVIPTTNTNTTATAAPSSAGTAETTATSSPAASTTPATTTTPVTSTATSSTPTVTVTNCGNGELDNDEQCDFGADNGKNLGCDSNCKIQSNWKCYTNTDPKYAELVTSNYQDSLKGLYSILANDTPIAASITPSNSHISSLIAQAKCSPAATPGWERQCAQYNQDLRRFKELNVNNSVQTAYGSSAPVPACDSNTSLFDPTDSSSYKVKCVPSIGVF